MPNPPGDDLSDMLNELAESQKRQEAELTELSGDTPNPPPLDIDSAEPFDAVLADQNPPPAPSRPQSPAAPAAPTRAANAPEPIEPAPAPLDDLIAVEDPQSAQHDAAAADMLADLANQADDYDNEPLTDQPVSLGAATSAPRALPTPQPGGHRRHHHHHLPPAKPAANIKAIMAPVLITLGIIMLVPATWAVLILMGTKTFMHNAQGVDTMAKLMLTCWPVGLGMLAGGVVAMVQLSREKARRREREMAMKAE